MRKLLLLLFVIPLFTSCGPAEDDADIYTPKPQGYFRIDLPKRTYSRYTADCPYSFEYPNIATVAKDPSGKAEPCWLNIDYPGLRARIYLSYKNVAGKESIKKLLDDTRTLVYKHTIKADDIQEKAFFDDDKKVYGNMYEIGGDAASSVQFFVTDSTRHFLRGALYFNCAPNADSLAPVITYIKEDVVKMMETMEWK
jgi:gliding motility-associated lipoprotein GldD